MNHPIPPDDGFDHRARAVHAASLQAIPTHLRARLKPAQPAAARAWGGWLAGGAVAMLAVGSVGIGMRDTRTASPPLATQHARPAVAYTPAEVPSYDNDPDFYAWLETSPMVASAGQ